jgi:hypothetical protein
LRARRTLTSSKGATSVNIGMVKCCVPVTALTVIPGFRYLGKPQSLRPTGKKVKNVLFDGRMTIRSVSSCLIQNIILRYFGSLLDGLIL